MRSINIVRKRIFHSDCNNDIKPEKGKVCQVILSERLIFQVGMHQSHAPQCAPAERKILKRGNKNAIRIAGYDMGDLSVSGYKKSYLFSDL
jgi:hypothetical protein